VLLWGKYPLVSSLRIREMYFSSASRSFAHFVRSNTDFDAVIRSNNA
jgi:hypothetical protein